MILEGLVSTRNEDGSLHLAPMGPRMIDASLFLLRPFSSSTTYHNLNRQRQGVLHVVDDVLLLAQCAIGKIDPIPSVSQAHSVSGFILDDCCRYFEFEVESINREHERIQMDCRILQAGRRGDFWGFNRGKHAVIEAAILATRVHMLDPSEIDSQLKRLKPLVEKTGGDRENAAFNMLELYISSYFSAREQP